MIVFIKTKQTGIEYCLANSDPTGENLNNDEHNSPVAWPPRSPDFIL